MGLFGFDPVKEAGGWEAAMTEEEIAEMEKKGYLSKYASNEDGRITYIAITEKGEELSERYDKNYYSRLLKYMDDISDDEADCMISTIEKFYKVMSERRVEIE